MINVVVIGKPFDVAAFIEVDEWGRGNQVAQKKPVSQFSGSNVFFMVAPRFFQHFVGGLIKWNDVSVVEQFFELEKLRTLFIRIPDGCGKG